eukprot:Opistho-2@59044
MSKSLPPSSALRARRDARDEWVDDWEDATEPRSRGSPIPAPFRPLGDVRVLAGAFARSLAELSAAAAAVVAVCSALFNELTERLRDRRDKNPEMSSVTFMGTDPSVSMM